MTNLYKPTILLNGEPLPDTIEFADTTAMAGLEIRWGSDNWFDPIEPAQLTVTLIDPFGRFLELEEHEGQEVQVTYSTTVSVLTIFYGNVTNITTRRITLTNPSTGKPRPVWEVQLTALDPLAALAHDRAHGPAPDSFFSYANRDNLHWGPHNVNERKQALEARSHVPIQFSPFINNAAFGSAYPVPNQKPLTPYERSQNVSVLTVLQNTARAFYGPMARVAYSYRSHLSDFGVVSMVVPSYIDDEGVLIDPAIARIRQSAALRLPLDGDDFEGEIEVSLDATEQVTRLSTTLRHFVRNEETLEYEMEEVGTEHTPVTSANSQSTFDTSTDLNSYHDDAAEHGRWYEVGNASEFIANIYRRPKLSPIIWRQTEPNRVSATALTTEIPTEAGVPTVFFMRNNLRNSIPKTGLFAITGGILTYTNDRWTSELWPSPVRMDLSEPTLGDLTTDHLLTDFTEGETLADLMQVTEG